MKEARSCTIEPTILLQMDLIPTFKSALDGEAGTGTRLVSQVSSMATYNGSWMTPNSETLTRWYYV